MAIPLLFLIPAAASGAYGIYKGGKALIDRSDAGKTNGNAQEMVNQAQDRVQANREATEAVLQDYGSRKLRSFNGAVSEFIEAFGSLKNVDLVDSPELEKLRMSENPAVALAGLKSDYQLLQDAGLGLGAGLGGGAALAFGAYNGTMALATASTGTAIATLNGVAATNATLAWLGGGAIAAGGGGIALGTMVLGGIVAGPALGIFGFVLGARSETALATAQANLEQAKSVQVEAEQLVEQLRAIREVTALANKSFSRLTSHLRRSVNELRQLIEDQGVDYSTYSPPERELVFRAVKFAQLVKVMIDTPIIDENGALVLSTQKRVVEIEGVVDGGPPLGGRREEMDASHDEGAEADDDEHGGGDDHRAGVVQISSAPAPLM